MCRAVGIVLNPFYQMFPWVCTHEVHRSYSPPVATTAMSDCDLSTVVASTLSMPDFRKCQFSVRPSFPEMVVDGSSQMSYTRRSGFVRPQLQATLLPHWRGLGSVHNRILRGS